MERSSPRWHQITKSEFSWEQEALDHVRELLPDREPFEAWANFEFISDHGQVYEVDLLVVTQKGFFLVEIKSRPGVLEGDGGTWTWRNEGRSRTDDNPLLLTNRKAKALKGLLDRQRAAKGRRLPFLQPCVFLSAEKLTCCLSPDGRHHVYGRDGGQAELTSIKEGLLRIDPEQFVRRGKPVDRPTAQAVARSLDQAGIRPSNRQRRVGDYELGPLLHDGPVYQDFVGDHQSMPDVQQRIRIYSVPPDADEALRSTVRRAAQREFRILHQLSHASILAVQDFKESDLGPALLFKYHPKAVRLDRYLADRGDDISMDTRLSVMRQVAEAIDYAHGRHVVHRGLSPSAVEIVDPDATFPHVQVLNWQAGAPEEDASSVGPVSGTLHVDRLVDVGDSAYLAPEVFYGAKAGTEQADVFSLGALAFLLFSGRPPASSLSELQRVLHDNQGLRIETALDGAGKELSELVRWATHPEVSQRTGSAREFLDGLTRVEEELTRPDEDESAVDPMVASAKDALAPGLTVRERLGQGSSSAVFRIAEYPDDEVLKVSLDADQDERVRGEWEILSKLAHPNIVTVIDQPIDVAGRVGVRMKRAGDQTLAQRLRAEGPVGLDLLRRFGEELLDTLDYLDGEGIAHRDIKPANLGVGQRTKKDELRLVLFDFSLSRTPREAIHAGTPPYLDPFLVHRTPPRWDEQAERFAAAVTLYEMATAQLPRWGDGDSDPAVLTCEATVDQELFEPSMASGFAAFFRRALARDPAQRFPTPRAMRDAWSRIFQDVERPPTDHGDEALVPIDSAQLDTALRALDLSVPALDVLERASVYTVQDLLRAPCNEMLPRRGVGTRVKREIGALLRELRRLGFGVEPPVTEEPDDGGRSIDSLAARLLPKETARNAADVAALRALLGLSAAEELGEWPSHADVARASGRSRAAVMQLLDTARERWRRNRALADAAAQVAQLVETHEGVVTVTELAASLLALRGSVADEPERSRRARAVVRATVEMEQGRGSALAERRVGRAVIVTPAHDEEAAAGVLGYVEELGRAADEIAGADPLLAPAAVRARLDEVARPAALEPLSDSRIVRLAAAASVDAAASSRLELYPRGMPPGRALRLARTALLGPPMLSPADIAARVHARFPDAAALPDRPALDEVLSEAGIAMRWDAEEEAFLAPGLSTTRGTSHTSFARIGTGHAATGDEGLDGALRLEQRLVRLAERGGFIAMSVPLKRLRDAERELRDERFRATLIDLDIVLLDRMRGVADDKAVRWEVVQRADAAPRDSQDWSNLQALVRLALPAVRDAILATTGVAILTNLGLLGRYGHIGLLEELRDLALAGGSGALTGVWLLAPVSEEGAMPAIDGDAIPVLTPDQWAAIPDAWLRNRHRAAAAT